jgi:signal transduction histidine kinase
VQESLTNVVRHAGAHHATVAVRHGAGAVTGEVCDDGRGPDGSTSSGHGIKGMGERVQALGGTFSAGAAPGGGFRVTATLPLEAPS